MNVLAQTGPAVEGTEIGDLGLAAAGILVLLTVAVSAWRGLGVERTVLWSATRALVQLLLVGAALGVLVDPARPLVVVWAWVAVMVVFAADTTRRRAPEVPGAFVLGLLSYAVATAAALAVLLGFGVFPPTGRAVIPLAGLMVGNSMSATVLAARRVVVELGEKREQVEARLALGLRAEEAVKPHLRAAVRTALIPQIETTKAVGIVFLPGAMVGLILAGVDPADAVRVQLAVMFLVLGSVAMTTTVMTLGLARRLCTPDHRLVVLPRRPD